MPRFDSTRRKPDYNILVFAALLTITFLLLVAGTAYLIFGLSRYHCVFVSALFIALLFAPRFLKNKFHPLTAAASRFARRRTPAVILVGVMSFILFQVFVNIGVNIRLVPVTGVPLPLVSQGGSSLITVLASLGILQSILGHRRKRGRRT